MSSPRLFQADLKVRLYAFQPKVRLYNSNHALE